MMQPGPHNQFLENLVEELIYLAIFGSLVVATRSALYPKSELKKEHTIIQNIFSVMYQ